MSELQVNVPLGWVAVTTRPQHGDIDNESARAGTNDGEGGVKAEGLTLVQAGELMGACYRQSKHIWKRYQVGGDAGLVHHLQGQASARRKPRALRAAALDRYAEERYADFGPTPDGGTFGEEKAGGRSRDAAALAPGRRPVHSAPSQARALAMAGAQAQFRGNGATGRVRTTTGSRGAAPSPREVLVVCLSR